MRELSIDESKYVNALKKAQNRSSRFLGAVFIIFSVLVIVPLIENFNKENLFSLIGTGSFFLLGVVMFFSSFKKIGRYTIEAVTGTFRKRYRKNHDYYSFGNIRVILPLPWTEYFQEGETYTIEVFQEKSRFFKGRSPVLTVQGMSGEYLTHSLSEMNEETREAVRLALRGLIKYGILFMVPVILIFLLPWFIKTRSNGILNFLNLHAAGIYGVLSYLEDRPVLFSIFTILFKYGWLIIILVLIITVSLVRGRMRKRSSKTALRRELGSWISWLREYEEFMEDEFIPMMARNDRDTTILMDYRKVMGQFKQYQQTARSFKKGLRGVERDEFTAELKRISRKR